MSSQEFDPTNQAPVREQIPHSGVLGFEKPVQEFDNTSLAEAEAQGKFIEIPTSPEALVSKPVEEEAILDSTQDLPHEPARYVERSSESPSKFKKTIVGVGTAAIAIAGVAFGVSKFTGNDNEQGTDQRQENSQTVNPKPSPESSNARVNISKISGVSSPEQSAYIATHPILVDGKPNAESAAKAIKEYGDYFNTYINGGVPDEVEPVETKASAARGKQALDMMLGPVDLPLPSIEPRTEFTQLRVRDTNSFAVYAGLESLSYMEPTSEATSITVNGQTLWQVPFYELHTGNWDEYEHPERNADATGTAQFGTYETPKGLAWYLYAIVDHVDIGDTK